MTEHKKEFRVYKLLEEISGETLCDLGLDKITADGDCSHEIKTLTSWKKGYDQPR